MKAGGADRGAPRPDPSDARGWAVLAPVYMRTAASTMPPAPTPTSRGLKGETADTLADQARPSRRPATAPSRPSQGPVREGPGQGAERPEAALLSGPGGRAGRRYGEAIRQLTELEGSSPPTAPGSESSTEPRPPQGRAAAAPTTPQAAPKIPAEQQAAIRGMVDGLDARLKAGGGTSDEWLRLRFAVVLGEPIRRPPPWPGPDRPRG